VQLELICAVVLDFETKKLSQIRESDLEIKISLVDGIPVMNVDGKCSALG